MQSSINPLTLASTSVTALVHLKMHKNNNNEHYMLQSDATLDVLLSVIQETSNSIKIYF